MSDLFENILTETYVRERMQILKEGKHMTWEQIAVALYGILDDIDTLDDACKENSESFRELVMKIQARKGQYMVSLDGMTVHRVDEARWHVFYKDPSQPGQLIKMKRKFLAPSEKVAMQQAELLLRQEVGFDHKFEVMGAERIWGKESVDEAAQVAEENLMSSWARKELELAGLFDGDSDYGGMTGEDVMKLMDTFTGQGHSGMSAALTADIFNRLAGWKPLTPLTNNPAEWTELPEGVAIKHMQYQSTRDPSCFSEDVGKTYWSVNDKCFEYVDEDGTVWNTGGEERWKKRTIHTSEPYKPE